MKNKLVFLGTAGDGLSFSRGQRLGGGFMLQLDGGQYHIDPGPGAVSAAAQAGMNPRETICVLLSNNSLFASSGVNEVVSAMTLDGLDPFGIIVASESAVHGLQEEQPVILRRTARAVERVVTFSETTRIGINYLNIYPRRASHEDPTAIGYMLESPSVNIGYTGDTGYFEGLSDEFKGCDVLVIRCRDEKGEDHDHAMDVEETIKLIEKVKPRLAVLTGFGGKLLDGDVIATARSIQRETKIQTVPAKDGFEVDLDQYKK